MNGADDAKRRLVEFGRAHDADKSPWTPVLRAAALGAGAGLVARMIGGRRRRGVIGPIVAGLPLAARVLVPLLPLVLAFLRSRPASASRPPRARRARVPGRAYGATPNEPVTPNGAHVC